MLDLASEMLAGATMEDVSTVLYYKVLQWAGYSQQPQSGRFRAQAARRTAATTSSCALSQAKTGHALDDVQNDPLVVDSLLPEIAHEMYPALFRTPSPSPPSTSDFIHFEDERVQEMIDIVREGRASRTSSSSSTRWGNMSARATT